MQRFWRSARRILRSKSGEGYIDACVFILIAGMTLAFVVSVFGVNWQKTSAQGFADFAARQIAADGAFSGSTVQNLTKVAGNGHFSIRLQTSDGYDATVPISTVNDGLPTKEIQEGTAFSVEITSLDTNAVGIGGVESGSVTVYGEANGISSHYWKDDGGV